MKVIENIFLFATKTQKLQISPNGLMFLVRIWCFGGLVAD
jgi:hypothetical protein